MDALTFLDMGGKAKVFPVVVLAGDEDFLKRECLRVLSEAYLDGADPAFALTRFAGDQAEWRDVRSELETAPFLSPRRVVAVDAADPFVTKHRASLEKYVAAPAASGVLILAVKTWAATTRLAKQVPEAATLVCKAPPANRVAPWCVKRAESAHGKTLPADAAAWLVELAGPELGRLDQELEKLAIYAGPAKAISAADVTALVGRGRAAETFKIFDAIGQGKAAEALAILDRLFVQGEAAMAILGAFSWQLRRLAQVSRTVRAGRTIMQAFDECGIPPFARGGIEQQLRHLGRERMDQIYEWLLEVDLGLKGGSELPDRVQMERLVVRLARKA